MNKHVLIWGVVAIFIAVSVYVTNHYSISEAEADTGSAVVEQGTGAQGGNTDAATTDTPDTATTGEATGATEASAEASTVEASTAEATEWSEVSANTPADPSKPTSAATVVGLEQATDFSLKDLAGNTVALSDFRGKGVYLNFWATWCKWCKKEMPDMESLHQEYKDKDFVLLAVSVGEERDVVAEFIEDTGYTFPVLLDPDKSISLQYGIKPIPVSLFIDREGRIAYKKLGTMKHDQMREWVERILR